MFNMGIPELILILVIGLLIFGPAKLPELGKSIGRGINEFKRASREMKEELSESINTSDNKGVS